MEIIIKKSDKTTPASSIPCGQLFYAYAVGNSKPGVFVKLEGPSRYSTFDTGIWPIGRDGKVAPDGQQYASPGCPVIGYDPITFELQ